MAQTIPPATSTHLARKIIGRTPRNYSFDLIATAIEPVIFRGEANRHSRSVLSIRNGSRLHPLISDVTRKSA